MTPRLTPESPLTVHCRECGAVPGQRCQTASGAPKSPNRSHFYRNADAADGAEPGPHPTQFERMINAAYGSSGGSRSTT